ncbi:MAG TPA: preprotein translocase subunit YajC [Acidimicrobiales bacterium]
MGFVLLIPLLVLMYVVLVRPQQQRVRRQRELIMTLHVDDEVVTAGGMIGRIVELADDRVFLEVADDVVIEVLRIAITRKMDEGAYQPYQEEDEAEPNGEAPAGEATQTEETHPAATQAEPNVPETTGPEPTNRHPGEDAH